MHKFLLICFALAGICFASCTMDTKCIDPEYYTLAFTTGDTSGSIEVYQKGSNFGTRLDTFYSNDLHDGTRTLVKLHSFRATAISTYDWKISLLPSGKVVKITEITVIKREEERPRTDNRRCTNNVSLLANGELYSAQGKSDVTSSVSFDIN